jgi:pimeloyl-ACP methyl ester carboxylesterase
MSFSERSFTENFYRSRDGLQLYYRDYSGDASKVPVLCLHGLTRNSRDFAALAQHIAPARRVIVPDQRGRGRSQYDTHWLNYHPGTYVDDMWTLLQELSVERLVVVGTSLGGLLAMLMAAMRTQMLAGVVLNDIGPEIDPTGAARIQSYAGRLPPVRTWDDAAAQMKMTFGLAMPDYSDERWLAFARQSFNEGDDGIPRLAADPKIGDAIRSIPTPPGATQAMWLAFGHLRAIPALALRGAHSDLLSAATFERMQREVPSLRAVTVANRGHAPQLDEPDSLRAIDTFLSGLRE